MTFQPDYILVDGSSYLFRAFHAVKGNLTAPDGTPTNAIYGVINMLRQLKKSYPDAHTVVVFDAKGKTFRNDLYPEYKANRPPMPDDLRVQIAPLHTIIKAQGYPFLMVDGVEADDVIGTLARQAESAGKNVLISTGDKDMAQLVDPHVQLINTMSNTQLDEQGVIDKFGVPPNRIRDYLALMGDASDNVPGVFKCGPKTAVKWLSAYDSMQGVIDHADEVGGKIGENLREAIPHLPLSYRLVTIKCDVNLDYKLDELQPNPIDEDVLREIYTQYNFRTWAKELGAEISTQTYAEQAPADKPNASEIKTNYETVFDEKLFQAWLKRLSNADAFVFDTETTSTNPLQAKLVGISFCIEAGCACYIPLAHDYPDAPAQLDKTKVLAALKPIFENKNTGKIGQHIKYDAHVLAGEGIDLQGITHDTMLQSYVLNSQATRHDMDSLAQKYLGLKTIKYEDIAGKGVKQLTFNQIRIEEAAPYAAEDADITLRLHQTLYSRLISIPHLREVYHELEIPLIPVLKHIEATGVLIDDGRLFEQSQEIESRLAELEREAHNTAGEVFNLGSPKQLQSILFEKMELPVVKKTPKGQPSTDESVLEQLAEDGHALPKLLMEHRGLSKLKSTYTDKLPQQINAHTGRIHTSYHQATAITGRLSSSDPNLQNIPVRTAEGRKIRQAFVPAEGYKLVAIDYSQIELRIMAHLSGDKTLINAFNTGQDIHAATAAEVLDKSLNNVTSEERRSAKAINFGLIYGMGAFGLAKQLDISRSQAQEYIELYFARYTGVKDYMDNIRERGKLLEHIQTLKGRRLYLPEINGKNGQRRAYAERTAINAPMQGTAADIIKQAMIDVYAYLKAEKPPVQMLMQVHDELVFEIATESVETEADKIKVIMEQAAKLAVPLVADIGIGDNWDEAH